MKYWLCKEDKELFIMKGSKEEIEDACMSYNAVIIKQLTKNEYKSYKGEWIIISSYIINMLYNFTFVCFEEVDRVFLPPSRDRLLYPNFTFAEVRHYG